MLWIIVLLEYRTSLQHLQHNFWTVGKVFFYKVFTFFLLRTYLLWAWPKNSILARPKHNVLNVFFRILQRLNLVLRSFFLPTLPCRSLLLKICCIVVLWTAQPVSATLFAVLFQCEWVLLSIWNLSWSSRPCLDFNFSIHLPFSNNVSDSGNR